MKMTCRKCGRGMDLSEFLTYTESYLIKAIEVAAVPLLVLAIKRLFATETRGFLDSHMAGLANNFKIVCPNCKKYVCWDPTPEYNGPQ